MAFRGLKKTREKTPPGVLQKRALLVSKKLNLCSLLSGLWEGDGHALGQARVEEEDELCRCFLGAGRMPVGLAQPSLERVGDAATGEADKVQVS